MAGDNKLRRTLSLWQVTVSGVGIVIGAGIYVLIGDASAQAGNAVWLSFIVAGVMSGLTGLSYAELASMFPTASAEYEFARRAFNEFLGFMAGWTMILANIIAAATVSIGFAHYANHFVDVDLRIAAAGLLFVLTLIVIAGVQRSIWLSVVLVFMQVGGLIMVIYAGAPHIGQRDLLEGATGVGVIQAAALVFFAFIGFDEVVTLSEETKNPNRDIPRALLLALGISTLLYVLVGICSVSVVGSEALGASDRPLTLVIGHDWSGNAADIVAIIALASTMNTALLVMTAASRLIYGMSQRGSLPRHLSAVGRRGHAPYVASAVVLCVALVFVAIGKLQLVASVTDLTVYVVFIFVNLSVIVLRRRLPDVPRRFRIPGSIGSLPVTPVLALITVCLLMGFLDSNAWLLAVACLAPGVVFCLLVPRQA